MVKIEEKLVIGKSYTMGIIRKQKPHSSQKWHSLYNLKCISRHFYKFFNEIFYRFWNSSRIISHLSVKNSVSVVRCNELSSFIICGESLKLLEILKMGSERDYWSGVVNSVIEDRSGRHLAPSLA